MQGKKISFTIHNFKFKYVRQKESTNNNLLSNNVKLKYAQSQMKSYLLSYMMTRQENDQPIF